MGLYVEVMCDVRKEWPKTAEYAGKLRARCESYNSDNPQGHTVAEAKKAAKAAGWKVRGGVTVCPGCLRVLPGE
jgi:hypothetical protein